ncbi:MAG TPA: DUF4403 family protein [Thermoanaerobaculia bacterium]|nr:DUF4403 family protein [Thermoanaerobaculia bacterium]
MSSPSMRPVFVLVLLVSAGLAAGSCASIPVPPSPELPAPSRPLTDPGTASFFFPVEVSLAELGRMLDAAVPRRLADTRKEEVAEALREDFYRYEVERGPVEVGSSGEWLTFRFPVRGKVTVGGRLRPLPLGRGLPVEETIELEGEVFGTAVPSVAPDWRLDLSPVAQISLNRADLMLLDVVPLNLRTLLEEKLNPVLNRELRTAAGQSAMGLVLRKEAEAAWRALHFSRKGVHGEDLWIRFQPSEITLAKISESGGVLRTGLGISGEVSVGLGGEVTPPPVSPLPPPRQVDGGEGRFELEIPVVATPEELSGLLDRSLRGSRHRLGRSRSMIVTAAKVEADGDRLLILLDFQESQSKGGSGAGGTLRLRGRPVFDPAKNVLRIADLQHDLATKNLRLRVASRLHREKLLKGLEKAARLDFTPTLRDLEAEARTALRDVLRPRGVRGEVTLEPVQVLSVGVADGAVYARCRVAGRTPALVLR